MREHKPSFIALLSVNLSPDSRIKRKLIGWHGTRTEVLLSLVVDYVARLAWIWGGGTQPGQLTPILIGETQPEDEERQITCYDTPEQWHEAMRKYQ